MDYFECKTSASNRYERQLVASIVSIEVTTFNNSIAYWGASSTDFDQLIIEIKKKMKAQKKTNTGELIDNYEFEIGNKSFKVWHIKQTGQKDELIAEVTINQTNEKYRVARYFDDIFECYVTGELSKEDARIKCNEFNSKPRAYVSYGLKRIA